MGRRRAQFIREQSEVRGLRGTLALASLAVGRVGEVWLVCRDRHLHRNPALQPHVYVPGQI